MSRIAIGGFLHETNSFVLPMSDYAAFQGGEKPKFSRGDEVVERLTGTTFPMAGFLEAMRGRHELVPLLWAAATAGGTVTREAYERIAAELVAALSRALPVDAVYLDLHGAMVSEDFDDGEGELLRRVRAVVGPDVPIVFDLDYHANVSPEMVALSDGMAAFRTYPHVDRAETGTRGARVLEDVLRRGRPTARAYRQLPFLIPLIGQCTLTEPSLSIVAETVWRETGDILSLCYLAGFPPSDTRHCGPTVSAYGYDQAAVDAAVDAVERMILGDEGQFVQSLLEPREAVARAMEIASRSTRPVILTDVQDNPGAGGTSDVPTLAEELYKAGAERAAVGVLLDPEAAAAATAAGEGATLTLALAGRSGPAGAQPMQATFKVARLADGRFKTTGPSVGGRDIDIGPMALLQAGGVSIVVSSKRMQAFDQSVFRHVGIEPAEQAILGLKSTVHFRADFEPLAETIILVRGPGANIVDATLYPYRRLRKGVRRMPGGKPFEG
ncbi:MAG: M81 family metallopeptidase [Hyphomicrobiaceae bacterium]